MIGDRKLLSRVCNSVRKRLRGQTATECALLLVAVALVVFASFSSVMARTASTTSTVNRQVAAANSRQGAGGGGVNIDWGSR